MSFSVKYDTGPEEQIFAIRKFANNSIIVIWIAGFSCFLIFIIYFLFFSFNAGQAGKLRHRGTGDSKLIAGETVFSDKTTLVNIGLRIQDLPENRDMKSTETIRIHKINYDRQLNITKRPATPGFTVKAVPK